MSVPAELIEHQQAPELTTAMAVRQPDAPVTTRMEMTIDEAKVHLQRLRAFVKEVLREGQDYGVIPGTDKPSLYKSGSEALCEIYALTIEQEQIKAIERWDDADPFFAYDYKTALISRRTGQKVAEGIGHANSKEAKWRYRWVFESQLPEGTDKTKVYSEKRWSKKKQKHFVMYRLVNEDLFSLVNTMQKMAAKRSMIDAVLKATRSSGILTQDLEDLRDNGIIPGDGDESDASDVEPASESPSSAGKPVSQPQLKRLYAIGKSHNLNADQVAAWVQEHFGCKPDELLSAAHKDTQDNWTDPGTYGQACQQLEAGTAPAVSPDKQQAARQKAVAFTVNEALAQNLTSEEIFGALHEATGFSSGEEALAGNITREQIDDWRSQLQLLRDQKARAGKVEDIRM